MGFALAGLLFSLFFVRESHGHARHEAALLAHPSGQMAGSVPSSPAATGNRPQAPSFKDIFLLTSWKNRTLFGVSRAGLVNNLNDGLAWGVFPLFFATGGLSIASIGLLAGVLADLFGISWAIGVIAGVTFLSGVIVQAVMTETLSRQPLVQTPST